MILSSWYILTDKTYRMYLSKNKSMAITNFMPSSKDHNKKKLIYSSFSFTIVFQQLQKRNYCHDSRMLG